MNDKQPAQAEGSGVKVDWRLPLPYLVGGALFLAGQAAFTASSIDRLVEKDAERTVVIRDLVKQVTDLRLLIAANSTKDTEHDLKIADLDRRLSDLQVKLKK